MFAQFLAADSPHLVDVHHDGHVVASDQDCLVLESAAEVPQG